MDIQTLDVFTVTQNNITSIAHVFTYAHMVNPWKWNALTDKNITPKYSFIVLYIKHFRANVVTLNIIVHPNISQFVIMAKRNLLRTNATNTMPV